MINYIFGLFLSLGILFSLIHGTISEMNNLFITAGEKAITMVLKMLPLLCLWLGLMKVASASGLMQKISQILSRLILPLFPGLKQDKETLGYIASNLTMNILGLGNAATPFGLKAFASMQKNNPQKDTATREMITLLVMNTASVTLIPTTIISLRTLNHAKNPTEILPPCIIATILACGIGLIFDALFAHFTKK